MSKLSSVRDPMLLGIFAKTERTVTQIEDLDRRIKGFFDSRPYEIVSRPHEDSKREVWSFKLSRTLPSEIPIIVGEILHNLRSALDQMLCAISLKHRGAEDKVAYPRGRNSDELEKSLLNQEKLLPAEAIKLIRRSRPYRDGGTKLLWALLELNRRDKHRVGLIPIQMPAELSMSYLCFWVGLGLVIGSKQGQHMLMEKPFDPDVLGFTGKPHALYDTRPGRLVFDDVGRTWDANLEFLTTTLGARFDSDFQATINIAFDESVITGGPAVEVLNDMRDYIESLLLKFEKTCF